MLGLSREYNFDLNCDVMLIGSDEVFNYTQNHAFGYVPCLFGYEINAQRIVSYAACAGYASITDIENDKMGDEISNGFNKMYKISVRDQNTYDIVNKYSTKTPSMVLDPTLIYDFDWSLTERVKVSKYILIYAYEGRLDEENEISLIRQFASQKGLITVSIGSYHHWCDENLVPTPFELLAYFAQSSYVITDTFHGTIFSIKCKKQFISLARKNNKYGSNENKVQYLLRQCGLYDRLLYSIDSFETEIIKPINYDETSQKIEILRASSLQFIKEALTVN
jgi:exopolysaccharide biosynthesis predicted pyruvyltransferase EpsI